VRQTGNKSDQAQDRPDNSRHRQHSFYFLPISNGNGFGTLFAEKQFWLAVGVQGA
jgi:hypothetical protein